MLNTTAQRKEHPIKKNYMEKLERAARWRLPREEAEDVIADYRDIVGMTPRSEEELLREVGDPEQVVKLLVSPPRAYRVWQAVFVLMAACILIPGISPHAPFWYIWDLCFAGPYGGGWGRFYAYTHFSHFGPILAVVGLVLSLVWFRRMGRKEGRLPKAVKILTAALLVWTGALLLVERAAFRNPQGFADLLGEVPLTYFGVPIGPNGGFMVPLSVGILKDALQYGGTAIAILGVYSLVKARTGDRRWAAVYCLSMAVMLVSMESMAVFSIMDISSLSADGWWHAQMGYYLAILAVGAAGTGVALC